MMRSDALIPVVMFQVRHSERLSINRYTGDFYQGGQCRISWFPALHRNNFMA